MKASRPIVNAPVEVTEQWTEGEPRVIHDGQIAADRLLLYLRCLNFPEVQALGLTLKAVMEVQRNTAPGMENNRVAEAMQVLFDLLCDGPSAAAHKRYVNAPPTASQPPLHRMHMVPEELSPPKTTRRLTAARRTSVPVKRPKDGAGGFA